MAKKKKAAIRNVILILFCLGLPSCAGIEKLTESIGGFFHGNTEVDKRDYDLEVKREYRKYRSLRVQQAKDDEEKILTNLSQEDQKKSRKTPSRCACLRHGRGPPLTTERCLILQYQKKKDTDTILEKLWEPYEPIK